MTDFEAIELDQIVDVFDNFVVINIPDIDPISFDDSELDFLFIHPERLSEIVNNEEHGNFWNSILPDVIRIREQKRELYAKMGF